MTTASRWLELSQEAFDASTQFIQANHTPEWDYALRAFRSEHAAGSKYLSEEYKSRSRLFRPKTRSVIRKNEAAGAAALFSNMEIVDLQPGDPDSRMSVAARDCMKALLEHRLGKTIPTFQIVMGGLQDAQTTGTVCSYQYWEYEERGGRKIKDKPCIDIRPIENLRLDAGSSWLDPVNTSPYFCDIIPMYVCDVKAMMGRKDAKTGLPTWHKLEDSALAQAYPDTVDSLRKARLGKGQDPHQETNSVKDFDVVWVMRWFMKDSQGEDHTYYTLGTEAMLTDPKPLEEVYFHGIRPYVMGCSVIETHKAFKSGLPILTKQLQQEGNDIGNMRIDNVKFVLHKRWFVARGRQVDVQSLVRGAPGGVTLMTDPKTDVGESNWPDVTSSAYAEQERVDRDFDDITGNFNPNTRWANKGMSETLGGNKMASQSSGIMTDYLLRTVIETWWEPVLRQLIKLEQQYETDENVLALCAKKAQLFPRYGLSQVTDDLLAEEVHLTVNVGMGSSNPTERFQKLIVGTNSVMDTIAKAPPNFNVGEFVKECMSNMGYRDGTRFWSDQADPRLSKAMQMIQQLQGALQGKQMELQASAQVEQAKLASNEKIKGAEIKVNYERIQGELQVKMAEIEIQKAELVLERMKIESEMALAGKEHQIRLAEMMAGVQEAEAKLEAQRVKLQADMQKTALEVARAQEEHRVTLAEGQLKLQGEREKRAGEAAKFQLEMEKLTLERDNAKEKSKKGPRTVTVTGGDGQAEKFSIQ